MSKKGILILTFILVAVFLFSATVFATGRPIGMIFPNTGNGCSPPCEGECAPAEERICEVDQACSEECDNINPQRICCRTYEACGEKAYQKCYVEKLFSGVMDFYGPDYCYGPCPE